MVTGKSRVEGNAQQAGLTRTRLDVCREIGEQLKSLLRLLPDASRLFDHIPVIAVRGLNHGNGLLETMRTEDRLPDGLCGICRGADEQEQADHDPFHPFISPCPGSVLMFAPQPFKANEAMPHITRIFKHKYLITCSVY